MSVLVYIDHAEGHIKKASFESLTYGADLARQLGIPAWGILLGTAPADLSGLGQYGISKVHQVNQPGLDQLDVQNMLKTLTEAVKTLQSTVIVFPHNQIGKALAPGLSVNLKAGLVTGATGLPETNQGFVVKKTVFSGKAFANVKVQSDLKIITLNPNSYHTSKTEGTATVVQLDLPVNTPVVKVTATRKMQEEIPLNEAEIVVSGGRGLKGPENWGMVEELAHVLHAATACSRPVADAGWRPHHEHVGQTGIQIAPNLYIAIGISGAIQHLAGVNRSKTMVVINKDPEAPFFKAADYGIVGDAFEVVPRLTAEIKKLKGL